jgi:hypothetical protein
MTGPRDIVDAEVVTFWWLVIRTPDGVWVWEMWPDGEQPDDVDDLLNAARVVAGYSTDDIAVRNDGFDIQMAPGQPHDSLLGQALRGTLAELRAVDAAAVVEHAAARLAEGG